MRYLPVLNTWDSCPDNACACGATGRVELIATYFGIHTVWAAGAGGARAAASGPLSVAAVERAYDGALGDDAARANDDDEYDDGYASGWADTHLALWAPSGTPDSFLEVSPRLAHFTTNIATAQNAPAARRISSCLVSRAAAACNKFAAPRRIITAPKHARCLTDLASLHNCSVATKWRVRWISPPSF